MQNLTLDEKKEDKTKEEEEKGEGKGKERGKELLSHKKGFKSQTWNPYWPVSRTSNP